MLVVPTTRSKRPCIALLICLLFPTVATSQSSQCAEIKKTDYEITLTARSWNPVAMLGTTLADLYGQRIVVEDPQWAFPYDTKDISVADPAWTAKHHNAHELVMKAHTLRVRFPINADGSVQDFAHVVQQIADEANKQMPYGYRMQRFGDIYDLVPMSTRDASGKVVLVTPMLDLHVTIPRGTRPIADHARLMAEQLSKQTGFHISCCQSLVAGVPWGLASVEFGADDQPAREVLRSLIQLEAVENGAASARHPDYTFWAVRCDGSGSPWCSIEVQARYSGFCRNW